MVVVVVVVVIQSKATQERVTSCKYTSPKSSQHGRN
jgi:hypothetical protein